MKTTLKNGALLALAELLNLDGWAKGHVLLYRAGKFLAEVLPEVTPPWVTPTAPTQTELIALKEWRQADGPEFEFSDADVDLCRECLKKLAETERLRPSKWTYQIQTAIKLIA